MALARGGGWTLSTNHDSGYNRRNEMIRKSMKWFPMFRVHWPNVILCFCVHPYHMAFGKLDDPGYKGWFIGPMGLMVRR